MEIWLPIAETDNAYEVSNHGRIKNRSTGKILIPRKTKIGYGRVCVVYSGKRRDVYIHRIVAQYFCNHPFGCDVVNHIDNNVSNNNSSNLEWVTQRTNVLYAMKQNRVKNYPNAIPVICEKDGIIQTFRSAHEGGEITGCDHSTIIKCCKGKKKTANGYKWKYAEVAL